MKIAIPTEEKGLDSQVCISFGRTLYFVVADTETSEFQTIDNSAASAQGGAGIKAAQAIADSGAKAVVTFHCGENAAEVLQAADIKIYRAVKGTAADMVKKFNAGELAALEEIHPGYHNHS